MAIRLSGSISRKIPIDGVPYSSQSFSCGMDLEISNPSEVQGQLVELYANLNKALDEQVARATQPASGYQAPAVNVVSIRSQPAPSPVQQQQPAAPQRNGYAARNRVAAVNSNGNGNGRRNVTATEAQCRAIFAICRAQNIDMVSVLADFNVADPKDLPIKDASRLIDQLKNGNGAAAL